MSNSEIGPSKHLTWKELACKDGTPYPDKFKADGRVYELAAVFESIRAMYGKPIKVLSAYRTPSWNNKIGGARNSMHLHGRALDLKPPNGIRLKQFYDDIYKRVLEFGITGLGRYGTFVHVDTRLTSKLVHWIGSGLKDSTRT